MLAQHKKYFSDITSVSDYYPFGSKMYGRRWELVKTLYRLGFNIQEKVLEEKVNPQQIIYKPLYKNKIIYNETQ